MNDDDFDPFFDNLHELLKRCRDVHVNSLRPGDLMVNIYDMHRCIVIGRYKHPSIRGAHCVTMLGNDGIRGLNAFDYSSIKEYGWMLLS